MLRSRLLIQAGFRISSALLCVALLLLVGLSSAHSQEQNFNPVVDAQPPFAGWALPNPNTIADQVEQQTEVQQQGAPDGTQTRMLMPIPAESTTEPEAGTGQETASAPAAQQDDGQVSINELINRVADDMNDKQLYKLEYRFPVDAALRWKVEHTARTETRMAGYAEKASMRSQSVKRWEVESVDSLGNMTFVYSIDWTSDWNQVGEAAPVSFDSRSNEEIPEGYEHTAETIGKPLAVISMQPNGQVIDEKTSLRDFKFGVDQTAIPLPADLVPIGHEWYVPTTLTATDEGERLIQLNARIHYELARVRMPNAYISFQTEVMTPINSPTVESQIMQQMTRGYLVFDMQRGMPLRTEVEWDEQVQGFQGPDSFISYVGKWTQKLLAEGEEVAVQVPLSPAENRTGAVELKTRDGRPVMRK